MKTEDLYITILKYGKTHLLDGVTYSSVEKYLNSKGYSTEGDLHRLRYRIMFNDVFEDPVHRTLYVDGSSDQEKFTLFIKMEAYFRLLEYEELKDARKSSKKAQTFSTIAIAISIVALGLSIYFSIKQINSPVTLEMDQFEQIQEAIIYQQK